MYTQHDCCFRALQGQPCPALSVAIIEGIFSFLWGRGINNWRQGYAGQGWIWQGPKTFFHTQHWYVVVRRTVLYNVYVVVCSIYLLHYRIDSPQAVSGGGEINWRERNIYGTQSTSSWSQEHAWCRKIIFFFVLECLTTKKLSRMSGILSFVLQDFWNARKSSFGGRRDPPDTPIFIVFALFI